MSKPIEPALTPDEWTSGVRMIAPEAEYAALGIALGAFLSDPTSTGARTRTERRHALAALALHGQPFGFTWEHVNRLWEIAEALSVLPTSVTDPEDAEPLRAIADIIAALLPPRE